MRRLFLLSFAAGFILSAAALHRSGGLLERGYIAAVHTSTGNGSARSFFSDIPERYVDFATTSTDDVRPKRQLWALSGFAGVGIGLRAFEFPALLQSLYPNYPDSMRKDEALLSRYFDPSRSFNSTLQATPVLFTNRFKTRYVRAPFSGCVDIYDGYGADTILFGSSEMNYSLIAQTVAETVSMPGRANRVLPCGRDSQLVPTAQRTADRMAQAVREKGQERAELVIYGYSFWLAYTRSPWRRDSGLPEQEQELRSVLGASGGGTPRSTVRPGLGNYFPALKWSHVFDFNIFEAGRVYEKNLLIDGSLQGIDAPSASPQQVNFSTNHPLTTDFVRETATNAKLTAPHMDGSVEADCDLSQAGVELDAAIDSLLAVGKKVFLYVPPVTPLAHASAPGCYMPALRTMLEARRRDDVFVTNGGWEEYGLDWTDYVFARDLPGSYTFDLTHLNAGGAAKVTEKIVAWINSEKSGPE